MDEIEPARGAGLRRPDRSSGDVLVVACQRHPWIASVALSVCGAGALTGSVLGQQDRVLDHEVLALLPLVTASFAAIGHIGRGSRATADRLAPWFAVNVVALAFALVLSGTGGWRGTFVGAMVLTLAIAVWPLASAAVLPGSSPGDETPIAAVAFPATIVAFPPAAALLYAEGNAQVAGDLWAIVTALCVPLVPLAFHALVRSRVSTRLLVSLSLACGVCWEVLHTERRPRGIVAMLLAPAAALGVGLLIAAARRARSMTAVPLDHPIVADFGGR